MPKLPSVVDQIRFALTNFRINTGRDAQVIYVGDLQWKLLDITEGDGDEPEINGVPVMRVVKDSHLRVS